MGLFQQKPKREGITAKIAGLEKKAVQLRAGGFIQSAERIEAQLRQYRPDRSEKIKPLSPGEMKKQVQGARATGQAK